MSTPLTLSIVFAIAIITRMVQVLRLDGPIAPYLSLLLVTFLGLFVWLSCQVAWRAEPHKASFFLLMKKLSALLKSALKTNWLALGGAVGVVVGLASLAVLLRCGLSSLG